MEPNERSHTMTSKEKATILKIAQEHFHGLETLETRHSDAFDFHNTAVWAIKAALEAAYRAGQASVTASEDK